MKTIFRIILVTFLLLSFLYAQTAPDTVWTKEINGIYPFAQQTHDGGLILSGIEEGSPYPNNIIRCNEVGDTLWTRSYDLVGVPGTIFNFYSYARETSDQGFIIGSTWTQYMRPGGIPGYWNHQLLKLDSNGDSTWASIKVNHYCGNEIYWIDQTSDQGYIATACFDIYSMSGGTLKFTDTGDTLWTLGYGGKCIIQTDDNGYLLTGPSDGSLQYSTDVSLSKISESGVTLWQKVYHKSDETLEFGKQILQTSEDGVLLLAEVQYYNPDYSHTWLIKANMIGDTIWTKTLDKCYNYIQQTTDNGYILIGNKEDDLWIVKLHENGNIQWTKTFNNWQGVFINETSDHGYIAVGQSSNNNTIIIRLETDPLLEIQDDNLLPTTYSLNQNYPNPFNPSTTIEFTLPKSAFVKLKVYNVLGKEVSIIVSNKLNQGNHTYTFDGKNLASGVYYYQLTAGDYREVKKMILLR